MSIMRTPPPNRYPIHTELVTFSSEVICDAINFEMSRNGQVYFVCDRISKLPELKMLIEKHIPDCRVAIGHGQMKPEDLEKIIMGFINYDYDVLLSTTIVENGIDISNANTIIVSDAHHFGLSDLHQMRGRVGRSNKKAFCYLMAPPKSALTPEARRRLEALETFSELVAASISPCRTWISAVRVICWALSRAVLWKIWVMKPTRRFSLRLSQS